MKKERNVELLEIFVGKILVFDTWQIFWPKSINGVTLMWKDKENVVQIPESPRLCPDKTVINPNSTGRCA